MVFNSNIEPLLIIMLNTPITFNCTIDYIILLSDTMESYSYTIMYAYILYTLIEMFYDDNESRINFWIIKFQVAKIT